MDYNGFIQRKNRRNHLFIEKMETIQGDKLVEKYLKNIEFNQLVPSVIRPLCTVVRYDTGETIINQGDEPENLYYMIQGRCSIHSFLSNGKKIILNNAKAPCLIGEIELLEMGKASFSVIALEKSVLIVMPLAFCRDILINDNNFLRKLCIMISRKETTNARKLIHISGFPLENRLADFILNNCEENCFKIKKVEVAESLGVSYRHLEKVMNDLVEKKYLRKEKLVYYLTNRDEIASLADRLKEE